MKVSLLFPPTWHPSQPYLSLPSLTGFLTQAGVKNVSQRDLGIELLDKVLTQSFAHGLYQQLVDKQQGLERERTGERGPGSAEQLARVIESLDRFPYLFERIELAKETLRGEGFYDIEAYRNSLFLIDKWLEVLSSLYFPTRMTVVDNQFGDYSIYSSKDLIKAIRDEGQNPYISLFREHVLPSLLTDRPDLVGVSITATSQIIPGLTLCRLIKEHAPELHVTVGGSIFTRLVDNLRRCPWLFDLVDDFVVFEGETALLELVNQMDGKRDFSKVPNLIYRQNGKITVNQPFYSENINQLTAPNYDGFPLDLYLSPEPVLPVQFSRGCYYKDCAFCAQSSHHQTGVPTYDLKSEDFMVDDATARRAAGEESNLHILAPFAGAVFTGGWGTRYAGLAGWLHGGAGPQKQRRNQQYSQRGKTHIPRTRLHTILLLLKTF